MLYYLRSRKNIDPKHGDKMVDKFFEINTLLDFYGNLLTDTQRKSAQMYYAYDYSLNEIATELNISKQAVSDNLKRAEHSLKNFEEKLKLVEESEKSKKDIDEKNLKLKILFTKLKSKKELDMKILEEIETMIFD